MVCYCFLIFYFFTGANTACCRENFFDGTLLPSVSSLKFAFMIQVSLPETAAVEGKAKRSSTEVDSETSALVQLSVLLILNILFTPPFYTSVKVELLFKSIPSALGKNWSIFTFVPLLGFEIGNFISAPFPLFAASRKPSG